MPNAKKTLVKLQVGEGFEEFEFEHAERILKFPNNGGWHLPDNSKYQFDKENGLTIKRNPRKDTEEA